MTRTILCEYDSLDAIFDVVSVYLIEFERGGCLEKGLMLGILEPVRTKFKSSEKSEVDYEKKWGKEGTWNIERFEKEISKESPYGSSLRLHLTGAHNCIKYIV